MRCGRCALPGRTPGYGPKTPRWPGGSPVSIRPSGRLSTSSAAADAMETARPAEAVALARSTHRLLAEQVVPHETAEERELYPALNRVLGGKDPTATMSRAHAEIAHQVGRLGRLLGDIGRGAPDHADVADLR